MGMEEKVTKSRFMCFVSAILYCVVSFGVFYLGIEILGKVVTSYKTYWIPTGQNVADVLKTIFAPWEFASEKNPLTWIIGIIVVFGGFLIQFLFYVVFPAAGPVICGFFGLGFLGAAGENFKHIFIRTEKTESSADAAYRKTKKEYENFQEEYREFQKFREYKEATGNGTYQESNTNSQQNSYSSSSIPEDLQKAMALFMVDDLNNLTMIYLKKTRNHFMAALHPDAVKSEEEQAQATEQAKKINIAYDLLKKYAK